MINYKKLYAYLVVQIDDTVQTICQNLLEGKHGFDELNTVGVKLRDALLNAEEMYLDDSGDSG